jgi:hypothetical protein
MIWCKDCVNDLYQNYWHKYGDVRKAIFSTCMRIDVPFTEKAYNMMLTQLKEKDYAAEKSFSIYAQKIFSGIAYENGVDTFDNGITNIVHDSLTNVEGEENRIKKWGNFGTDDLDFLDYELDDWQKTHSCENKAELTLLKEICIKELMIRQTRNEKKDDTKLVKDLQELMKTANVDPAKANAINAGKSVDCYGVWVKDFEEKSPAEWFEDQKKFKDMDGLLPYIKNYIIRPIKNFLTGSRDFAVDDELDADLDSVDIGSDIDGS